MIDTDRLAGNHSTTQNIAAFLGLFGNQLDHRIVHIFVGTQFNRLILGIVINDQRIFRPTFTVGHIEIKKSVDKTVLQFVKTLQASGTIAKITDIVDDNHLRAAFIDVLVFQMLSMGQNVDLTQQSAGSGEEIIRR